MTEGPDAMSASDRYALNNGDDMSSLAVPAYYNTCDDHN